MLTIPFLISIVLNALIGSLPILGPVISGFFVGAIVGRKNPAMIVGFLGAIIGGVFCRIFLFYHYYAWNYDLLYLFSNQIGSYTETIIRGNTFYFVLYFGLLGMGGGFLGAFTLTKIRNL